MADPEPFEREPEPPGIEEVRRWAGFRLDEIGGGGAGRVEAPLVDATDGTPSWIAIRLGRFGHRSALPAGHLAGGGRRVWCPWPRAAIRALPAVDPAAGLSCGEERELARQLGLAPSDRRLAAIADRDPDEPGSVPDPGTG